MPKLTAQFRDRLEHMPELVTTIHPTGPGHFGVAQRGIIGLVNGDRLRRILTRMLDENEFLSPYGIRSLSLPCRSPLRLFGERSGIPSWLPTR